MKYHNPVKCMSDTHSFGIFSFKHKKNKILNNRKVVSQWDLFKSEVFSTTDHYSGRETIKITNKQTLFLEDEPIIRNFRSIGKFLLKTNVFEVFLQFTYPEGRKSYIIKTSCWFLVEADQTYLIYLTPHSFCLTQSDLAVRSKLGVIECRESGRILECVVILERSRI